MFKINIWILLTFCSTTLISVDSYRGLYDGLLPPSTPYPLNRRNWQRSDSGVQNDDIYSYGAQGEQRSFSTGANDWQVINTSRPDTINQDLFRIREAQRKPVVFEPNPGQGDFHHTEHHHHPHDYSHGHFQPELDNQRPVLSSRDDILSVNGTSITPTNPDEKNRPYGDIPVRSPQRESTFQPTRDIVFPDEDNRRKMLPRCAQSDKLFCTQVENYPKALIESVLISDAVKYNQLFGEDIVLNPDTPMMPNFEQRIDAPGEESLCNSVEKLIYPQAGITKDDNWSFIVNQQNFTQGVRVEECMSPGKPCLMANSFPNNYVTECRQKFIYRQLLSVNQDGRVVKDLFKLPSCCKCILKTTQTFERDVSSRSRN